MAPHIQARRVPARQPVVAEAISSGASRIPQCGVRCEGAIDRLERFLWPDKTEAGLQGHSEVSLLNQIATELQGAGIVCQENTDSASSDLHSLSGVGIESGLLSKGIVVFQGAVETDIHRNEPVSKAPRWNNQKHLDDGFARGRLAVPGNVFDHVALDRLARNCGQGNGESIPIGQTDREGITARYADETFQRLVCRIVNVTGQDRMIMTVVPIVGGSGPDKNKNQSHC